MFDWFRKAPKNPIENKKPDILSHYCDVAIYCGDNSNKVRFYCDGNVAIEIGSDGFWVNGKKVEQGDGEALAVYNAFLNWCPLIPSNCKPNISDTNTVVGV